MNPQRWNQVQALFDDALALPADQRAPFLDGACDGDAALRAEVASLLAAFDETGLVDNLAHDLMSPLVARLGVPPSITEHIGPYRVIRTLGQGGMGTVYLAERDDAQFQQQVAIKLVRQGLAHPESVRRFLHERQILARLTHPGIARLLDGGVTDQGQPYFAMEFIDGVPIDTYCDQHRLSIRNRLRLFCRVGEAVQYAHQNLVVHRDLKPSNTLVLPPPPGADGALGLVKLLDFGIAKLLDADADGVPLTQTGMRIMTPAYAAPEQIRGLPVTTASDVYALGVMLYELLTGHRPYGGHGASKHELERAICEDEPERPSTAVGRTRAVTTGDGTHQVTPQEISTRRSTQSDRLRRVLRGDLDTIVLKALQKEPERRYASADQLVADVRRYLAGLPVTARPDTASYRARKFVRRNKVGVVAGVLLTLSLLGGLAGTASQARRADQQAQLAAAERDKARSEAAKAAQVSTFLVDLFKVADPRQAPGSTISAREILDQGAAEVATGLDDQPEVQATMMAVMGQVYRNLGLFEDAAPLTLQALELRRRLYGENHPDVAASLYALAALRHDQGDFAAATALFRQALALQRTLLPPTDPHLASTLYMLARTLSATGHAAEARPLFEEAIAVQTATLGNHHPDLADSRYYLGGVLHSMGDFGGAEAQFRAAVAIYQALPGEATPAAADSRFNLGMLLLFKNEYAEAEALFQEALAIHEQLFGPEHPAVAADKQSLAQALGRRGAYAEAEARYREVIPVFEAALGPDHTSLVWTRQGLGEVLYTLGRYDEAVALFEQALVTLRQVFGPDHGTIVANLAALAKTRQTMGDLGAAERYYREGLAMAQRLHGEAHTYVALHRQGLGTVAHARGDLETAIPLLRETLAMMRKLLRPEHDHIVKSLRALAAALLDQGEAEEAVTLLNEALTIRRQSDPDTHWRVGVIQGALGEGLTALGRFDEAEAQLTQAHATIRDHLGATHPSTRHTAERLAALYLAWGRPEQAALYR